MKVISVTALSIVLAGCAAPKYDGPGTFQGFTATTNLAAKGDGKHPFTPGNIVVASFATNEVFEFDPGQTSPEIRAITVTGPGGLAFGGPLGHLFVASIASGRVSEFDRNGNLVRSVAVIDQSLASPADYGLRGLTSGRNGNLFLSVCGAEYGGDLVLELDGATLQTVREIRQSPPVTLTCPGGIGFGPDGILHIGGIHSGNVIGLDLARAVPVGDAAAPVFEAPTVRDISILADGGDPRDSLRALAFGADGTLYVSGYGLGHVAAIGPGGTAVARRIKVGIPTGIRLRRGRHGGREHLFVGDLAKRGVLEIDLATAEIVQILRNNDQDLDARFVIFVPDYPQ